MSNKKKIYIILTYTGTILSKIIKGYTRAEYCHVSLALDENLEEMYSFGRIHPYNPFIGGFVHEGINIGTFKRFKNTKALIYSLEIDEIKYEKIKSLIKKIEYKKDLYRFNTIGLFASGFNIRVKRKYYFYCAEFVKYLLDESDIDTELPEIIKPIDFKEIDNLDLKYSGFLKNYGIISN